MRMRVVPATVVSLLVTVMLSVGAGHAAAPAITAISPSMVGLPDHLDVTIDNLEKSVDIRTLRLILNEYKFANLVPDVVSQNQIRFDLTGLRKDADNGWVRIAGRPPFDGISQVQLAISSPAFEIHGQDGQFVSLRLRIFNPYLLAAAACVFLVIMGLLVILAAKTTMLRDTRGDLTAFSQPPAPFSLAKCQVAFWFALILGCFLGLLFVTQDFNNIVTPQSLTLLGISGLTAVGASSIDAFKGGSSPPTATDPLVVSDDPEREPPEHLSFWKDLMTDDSGWVFHRVQIVIWTLILGMVSLWSAYSKLALPEFDQSLLILMGISSGLYLGLKFPEKQTDKPLPR
jgi:hypothetical protein